WEALNDLRSEQFSDVDSLDGPLEVLAGHNYVRERQEQARTGPGRRPAPTYEVNPAALALGSQVNHVNQENGPLGEPPGPPEGDSLDLHDLHEASDPADGEEV